MRWNNQLFSSRQLVWIIQVNVALNSKETNPRLKFNLNHSWNNRSLSNKFLVLIKLNLNFRVSTKMILNKRGPRLNSLAEWGRTASNSNSSRGKTNNSSSSKGLSKSSNRPQRRLQAAKLTSSWTIRSRWRCLRPMPLHLPCNVNNSNRSNSFRVFSTNSKKELFLVTHKISSISSKLLSNKRLKRQRTLFKVSDKSRTTI